MRSPEVVWRPSDELANRCALRRFMDVLKAKQLGTFLSFDELHRWSVDNPESFWSEVVHFVDISGEGPLSPVWNNDSGPTPLARKWFPRFNLNFAENLLGEADETVAIVSWSEDRLRREISRSGLRVMALSLAHHLHSAGVHPEDRVFGYMPNIPEAVVCMLGAAGVGATWSSCGTDYQVDGLLARISRVQPKVLVSVASYLWRGKVVDTRATIAEIVRQTPSVERVILINYLEGGGGSMSLPVPIYDFAQIVGADTSSFEFKKFPFSHPLYIMFSSGTTGKPKGLVHSAGALSWNTRKSTFCMEMCDLETLYFIKLRPVG